MDQEFEYTVERRHRINQQGDDGRRPVEPVWGDWSKWGPIRIYPTLAGAAMAKGMTLNGIQREYYEPKAPYAEYQTRVSYRVVPAEWTPLLPDLGGEE